MHLKRFKSNLGLVILSAFLFFCGDAKADTQLQQSLTQLELWTQRLNLIQNQFGQRVEEARKQNADENLQSLAQQKLSELEKEGEPKTKLGKSFFKYYRARLRSLSGEDVMATSDLRDLIDSSGVSIEAIDGFFEIANIDSKEFRTQHILVLGKLLPVSSFGRSWSKYLQEQGSPIYVRVERPIIPAPKIGRPEQDLTADRYLEMKLYDLAARDYLETIYGSFAPPRIKSWYWESWLSPTTAPLWLKTAQCEWQMGRADTAANYIAKAIVFGSDATKDEALKVLEEWKTNGLPDKPPAPQPDAEKLKQIARQYAQMNMHPRAIEVMKEFAPVIGPEAATLQQQYEAQWLKLVASYCVGTLTGKCVVFGQDVSRPENRLKVQIPPPLRPQALEQAAAAVRALNAEKPVGATKAAR